MLRLVRILTIAAGVLALAFPGLAAAGDHKVAIHVDEGDAAVMNLALNNVENVRAFYQSKGEKVTIELVTYGPGLNMLLADKSPVKERISAMSLEDPTLQFSACGNTLEKMIKKAGKTLAILPEATLVPSGMTRLMELQEQGYSYVKP
jgi:intracellular sulfur oxidation DsrE/DsrF family protein